MAEKLKSWQEIPMGGLIVEAGNAYEYETGSWRSFRPVVDQDSCTDCLLCWLQCPDASIKVEDGKMVGLDYEHCKGCGICAEVCPTSSITMHPESEFMEEGSK
ncbi:MAG: 4Fe-4S binding protein [Anaerolineae bacterium]